MSFIAVTDITNFNHSGASLTIGEEVELTATVVPSNATHQEMEWSVISPIGGATFRTTGTGASKRTFMTPQILTSTMRLRATVRNGVSE